MPPVVFLVIGLVFILAILPIINLILLAECKSKLTELSFRLREMEVALKDIINSKQQPASPPKPEIRIQTSGSSETKTVPGFLLSNQDESIAPQKTPEIRPEVKLEARPEAKPVPIRTAAPEQTASPAVPEPSSSREKEQRTIPRPPNPVPPNPVLPDRRPDAMPDRKPEPHDRKPVMPDRKSPCRRGRQQYRGAGEIPRVAEDRRHHPAGRPETEARAPRFRFLTRRNPLPGKEGGNHGPEDFQRLRAAQQHHRRLLRHLFLTAVPALRQIRETCFFRDRPQAGDGHLPHADLRPGHQRPGIVEVGDLDA